MASSASPQSIHEHADRIVESDARLVIKAYGVIHSTEDFMREFVRKVTLKFDRLDLAPALEIIVKELTMNAVKANFKKIFFAENNLDIHSANAYSAGMNRFLEIMSEDIFVDYGRKARAANMSVETSFDFDQSRIIIEVRNNVPMTTQEERRAREKMERALQYEDMGAFLMEQLDEAEGAGAGLALCMTTMRSVGLDPRLLTIASNEKLGTLARVEVPLLAGYVPIRQSWQPALAG